MENRLKESLSKASRALERLDVAQQAASQVVQEMPAVQRELMARMSDLETRLSGDVSGVAQSLGALAHMARLGLLTQAAYCRHWSHSAGIERHGILQPTHERQASPPAGEAWHQVVLCHWVSAHMTKGANFSHEVEMVPQSRCASTASITRARRRSFILGFSARAFILAERGLAAEPRSASCEKGQLSSSV